MKADNVALLEFIGASKRTFYIPVYQRNYDWKKVQCQTLFKDIEAIAVSANQFFHQSKFMQEFKNLRLYILN